MNRRFPLAALGVLATIGSAQAENYSLSLSDPSKPASVEVQVMSGSITVQGYEGKTIEISSSLGDMSSLESDDNTHVEVHVDIVGDDKDQSRRSTKGLKKVINNAVQIQIEERHNKVEIGSETRGQMVNLTIKVPYSASLDLELNRGGDIHVNDVEGSLELSNNRGAIYAENISGPIVAESYRKDIEVVFKGLDQKTPSSLTSHRGSVDVTLPATMKAQVEVQTYRGEIYSGLDVPFKADNTVDKKQSGSGQEITIGGLMSAKIGGGGQKLTLATYSGDIYVRKSSN